MKQRSHAFDFLCGICIIRMVMLHVFGVTGFQQQDWWKETMQWSYYFMCFFFFKAGYFNKSVGGDSWDYCKDKFKRLLVPYFSWAFIGTTIYLAFCLLLPKANVMVKDLRWSHLWEVSEVYGNTPLWFLMSFFATYIAVHFIEKVKYAHWLAVLFPFVSWWLCEQENPMYLSLDNVPMGIFVFYLGRAWRRVMDGLAQRPALILSAAFTVSFCVLNFLAPAYFKMSENLWEGNPVVLVISVVFALCGLSGLLMRGNIPYIPVLCYIGMHSMVYFVAHFPILTFYKMLRSYNVRSLREHSDDAIILLIMVFAICSWIVPYVERIPWLSGRGKGVKS